ncbi:DUF3888 domain-containing protein [Aureibacillus halotolerans]|uniref:DUF3888 domain-containing protein n=1 Tax=Aureibacillus halotolerans TaxID=1508390 RepID=UPI003C7C3846
MYYLAITHYLASNSYTLTNHQSQNTKQQLIEDALILSLSPVMQEAVDHYFGTTTQYWRPKLLHIGKDPATIFTVHMQVETFVGPHNPPYHLVNLTLTNDVEGWKVRQMNVKKEMS